MADTPSFSGNPPGKREYEVQLRRPNYHRKGHRWDTLVRKGSLQEAQAQIEDFQNSLVASGFDATAAHRWALESMRVREVITLSEYGQTFTM